MIVFASEIINPETINDVAKARPEEEAFISILNKIDFETIDQPELYLSELSLFYAKIGADKNGFVEVEQKSNTIGTIRLIYNQLPEQVFNKVLALTLKTSNSEINTQKKYGGGMVYEVKQGNFVT